MKSAESVSAGRSSGVLSVVLVTMVFTLPLQAQQAPPPPELSEPFEEQTPPAPPRRVEVKPVALDHEIERRITDILKATTWFTNGSAQVRDGVVFLDGETAAREFKEWAGNLAGNTEGVTAVVNRIAVVEASIWNFEPMLAGLRGLWNDTLRRLPMLLAAVCVLAVTWLMAKLAIRLARPLFKTRIANALLREVAVRAVGAAVFIMGLYIIFHIAGLTRLAATILGGTGLLGLILGIAFREISENFLASIFLSIQSPFRTGDLIKIDGITGFVQRVTMRASVLMSFEGNHVQIPNATVYRSNIWNYTSNPNVREEFVIGIGYDVPITRAQETALRVLADHPAVLADPEPWVLVENLGSTTVNLRIYFWLDRIKNNQLKVKSAVIRLVKNSFQEAGISMPDEARELIFPQGVPVRMLGPMPVAGDGHPKVEPQPRGTHQDRVVTTEAEAGLQTEAEQIEKQAKQARMPEEGENLLAKS